MIDQIEMTAVVFFTGYTTAIITIFILARLGFK